MSREPPFNEGIDHIDLTEAHERKDLIKKGQHFLSDKNLLEIINLVDRIFQENGTRRTLSQLTSHEFMKGVILHEQAQQDEELIRHSSMPIEHDPGIPPRLVEYGVGITIQNNVDTSSTQSFKNITDHLLAVMNWYFRAQSMVTPLDDYEKKGKYKAAHNLLFRQLATRRFVEGRQYLEKAYRAYKPFDTKLEDILGFNIEDAIYYQYGIVDLTKDYGVTAGKKQLRYTDSLLETNDEILQIAEDYLWIKEETLFDYCDSSNRFKNFLDRMSERPGNFDDFWYPSDVNPLQIHPLVKHKNEYLLPLPGALPYAIGNTFYYDLIDTDISGEFGDTLGNYLEEWTVDCFEKIFPNDEIFSNVRYQLTGGTGETDAVIIHDTTFNAIECKTKKLTAETRKGEFGGLNVIEEDVEKSIGKGFSQADELVKGIKNGSITELSPKESETIQVSGKDFDTYNRIIVLGESFGPIATRGFARILDIDSTPYVVDIFDLQIITHVLEKVEHFLRYIEGRIKQIETQTNRSVFDWQTDIYSPDEIDYLAYFKHRGMKFKSVLRDIVGQERELRRNSVDEMINSGDMKFHHPHLE